MLSPSTHVRPTFASPAERISADDYAKAEPCPLPARSLPAPCPLPARSLRRAAFGLSTLGFVALGSLTTPAAQAQTILSGHYDNTGNGFDTVPSGSPYTVTSTATFNNDSGVGLFVYTGTTVTVNGGSFNLSSGGSGLDAYQGSLVTINNGVFDNDYYAGVTADAPMIINGGMFNGNTNFGLSTGNNGDVTINGGTFDNNNSEGLAIGGSTSDLITINGGNFTGNGIDIVAHGAAVNIFGGTFNSIAALSPITLYGNFSQYGALPGFSGSFTGTLQNSPTPQTISYYINGGQIFLAPAISAVPEPSALSLLALGGLGLLPLALRRRRA